MSDRRVPLENATDLISIKPLFGSIRMETRMRPEGNRIIGEGRIVALRLAGWEPY